MDRVSVTVTVPGPSRLPFWEDQTARIYFAFVSGCIGCGMRGESAGNIGQIRDREGSRTSSNARAVASALG